MEETLKKEPRTSFRRLLEGKKRHGKMQVIVTFLAVLELMKVGKLTVKQEGTFGEIYIQMEAAAARKTMEFQIRMSRKKRDSKERNCGRKENGGRDQGGGRGDIVCGRRLSGDGQACVCAGAGLR